MDKSDIRLLMQYNRWANGLVLAACHALTEAQIHAPAQSSFGSILGTLAHIYGAERNWRPRLQEGQRPTAIPGGADFATLADLESAWTDEMEKMQAFTNGLDGADLERWVEYTLTSGKPEASTLWKALVHVVNHGTAFRAEAGAVLGALGHSPGDLDLMRYLRETDQR